MILWYIIRSDRITTHKLKKSFDWVNETHLLSNFSQWVALFVAFILHSLSLCCMGVFH